MKELKIETGMGTKVTLRRKRNIVFSHGVYIEVTVDHPKAKSPYKVGDGIQPTLRTIDGKEGCLKCSRDLSIQIKEDDREKVQPFLEEIWEERNEIQEHAETILLSVGWVSSENSEIEVDERWSTEEKIEKGKEECNELDEKTIRKAVEQHEAKQAKKEKKVDALQKAKESGEKVEINSFMADCNDLSIECSFDNVIQWATPEGEITYSRTHCY